jgi:hypothetical protein
MEFQVEEYFPVPFVYLIDNRGTGDSIQFKAHLEDLDHLTEPVDQFSRVIIFGNIKREY